MINNLTFPRGLLCAFLLLACSSAEATSISYPLSPRNNLGRIIVYQVKKLSVTNSPINTVQPVCEVLKKMNVTAYSYKQWHYAGIAVNVCIWAVCALGVLYLTQIFSRGMTFCIWLLLFISYAGLNHDAGSELMLQNLLAVCIIFTKDFPRATKAVAGVSLATLVASLGAIGVINLNGLSYVDDYVCPEYLVSSTSTNIVAVHEKMDLPYAKYGKSRKQLLFRDGRIRSVSTNELGILLQAQAEEIRMFRQATTLNNPE